MHVRFRRSHFLNNADYCKSLRVRRLLVSLKHETYTAFYAETLAFQHQTQNEQFDSTSRLPTQTQLNTTSQHTFYFRLRAGNRPADPDRNGRVLSVARTPTHWRRRHRRRARNPQRGVVAMEIRGDSHCILRRVCWRACAVLATARLRSLNWI
jgi:hypothetical protein